MKVTIDIPEELYRRVKARSALEGRTVREVTTDLYGEWLAGGEIPPGDDEGEGVADPAEDWLAGWESLGRRLADHAADDRTTRRILHDDRR